MIYTITLIEQLEPNKDHIIDTGEIQCAGFRTTKADAEKEIKDEADFLYAKKFNYLLIEELPEGICTNPNRRWLYHYDPTTHSYKETAEPACMRRIYNFALR